MDTATATPTPATSAPSTGTPSAAPAIAAPAPSISADQRPSMAQAFANDAAQPPSESSAQPEGATTPPADASTEPSALHPSTETKPGEPPQEKWPTILANARTKAGEEAVAQFVQRPEIQKTVDFSQRIVASPPGFWKDFTNELLAHPEHGPVLKSELGRLLGGMRAQQQADAMPGPDVQIVDQQGNVTGATYSAEQLAKRDAWRDRQADQRFDQRLQPFEQERAQKQAEAQAADTARQIDTHVDQHVARIDQILDGKANEYGPLIADLILKDKALDPIDAALQIRKSHILPKLQGQANAQVLEDLKTKAAAQGMNPSRAGVATTHKPTSFLDKSLEW